MHFFQTRRLNSGFSRRSATRVSAIFHFNALKGEMQRPVSGIGTRARVQLSGTIRTSLLLTWIYPRLCRDRTVLPEPGVG